MNARNQQLDLLRGVAVLLVLACHYPYSHFLLQIGWAGVDLFFVLSGFLISGLLFLEWKRSGSIRIGRFFIRRGFKIYPTFYVFLLITLALKTDSVRDFWKEFLFLQDYLPHFWGHTWSLAVEEQFYLVLPLLLLVLARRKRLDMILVISIVLVVFCLGLRVMTARSARSFTEILYPAHLRADALFAGVALAYLFHFREDRFLAYSRWWLAPLGIAALAPLVVWGQNVPKLPIVLAFNTLAFSALVLWIVPRVRVRCRVIEKIGVYSYSIYVWHYFIARIFFLNFTPTLLKFLLYIGASLACGFCAAKAVEFPVLRLRDRLAMLRPQDSGNPGEIVECALQPRIVSSTLQLPKSGENSTAGSNTWQTVGSRS